MAQCLSEKIEGLWMWNEKDKRLTGLKQELHISFINAICLEWERWGPGYQDLYFVHFWFCCQECFQSHPHHLGNTRAQTHTHTEQNDSSARLRARGPGWCCVVCAYASVWKNLRRGLHCMCVYMCVCVWSGCVVSGAGLGRACWRLGWEKSRCVYFTLGAVHGHGNTAQTPFYNTSMHARTHIHAHNHKETKNIPPQVSCHTPPQTHCKLSNRSYNFIQAKWMSLSLKQ